MRMIYLARKPCLKVLHLFEECNIIIPIRRFHIQANYQFRVSIYPQERHTHTKTHTHAHIHTNPPTHIHTGALRCLRPACLRTATYTLRHRVSTEDRPLVQQVNDEKTVGIEFAQKTTLLYVQYACQLPHTPIGTEFAQKITVLYNKHTRRKL